MLYAKVKQVRRPSSGDIIGARVQLAVPNNSGNPKFDVFAPNGNCVRFTGKEFLVGESSDLVDVDPGYLENWLASFNEEIVICQPRTDVNFD